MGCGLSSRELKTPIFTNDFNPPSHELAPLEFPFPENFPPSGVVSNENGTFFDDREYIKQCQIVHIHEIAIYIENYITGIEIHYYLDGAIKISKHFGLIQGKKHVMEIEISDGIINAEVSFDGPLIQSIRFETIEGRIMDVVSPKGHAKQRAKIVLKTQKRAIVAFKGKIGDYIEGLRAYSWKLCDRRR
ncbi:hypothetical protein SteCoe_28524 [Stentor coeruleus]|uniref:Jacalin-type lectin domain-containing protein n=1 Tax=Stentor coeruleus TaxID=5963 RepID=A0A1R2B802_9CILI|nr:hypothetical protein SteCoe_28524 [Stentor coeruleus]